MNIAIVEDFISDYRELQDLLAQDPTLASTGLSIDHFTTGEEFLTDFHAEKYQLIFLDIVLAGTLSGMDTARQIRSIAPKVPIVFTTGEREYALEGYEVQAMDYLLKPYAADRVSRIIRRLMEEGKVETLLTVRADRTTVRFPLDILMWASARDHTVEIHLDPSVSYSSQGQGENLLRTYMTFEEFTSMIPNSDHFQCCYRGLLVNLKYVDYMEDGDFIMVDGVRLPVSRSNRTRMQAAFNAYQIQSTRLGGK